MIMEMDYKVFTGTQPWLPTYISAFLTVEFGSEAETVIALILLVPVAIVTNASGCVFAATLVSGMRDRVLDRTILQPSRITPVQPFQPGLWREIM